MLADEPVTKEQLYNLIAYQKYSGNGPWPNEIVFRWKDPIRIGITYVGDVERSAELASYFETIIARLNGGIGGAFPRFAVTDNDPAANIRVLIGGELDPALAVVTETPSPLWRQMASKARSATASLPVAATCVHVSGDTHSGHIVAGLIFISAGSATEKQRRCALEGLLDVVGLHASSIFNPRADDGDGTAIHLQPIEIEALRIIYDPAVADGERLADAIDAYLTRRK